jgi:hypothetical protein
MDGARKLILVSPTRVDGAPGRVVTYPDGSVMVQKWVKGRWVTDQNRVVAQPKPEPAGDETLADFTVSTTAD